VIEHCDYSAVILTHKSIIGLGVMGYGALLPRSFIRVDLDDTEKCIAGRFGSIKILIPGRTLCLAVVYLLQ